MPAICRTIPTLDVFHRGLSASLLALPMIMLTAATQPRTEPVSFAFALAEEKPADPWAAKVWGEIETPSGIIRRLPAYFDGENEFVVRSFAGERGNYRLHRVLLADDGGVREVGVATGAPATAYVETPSPRSSVHIANHDPRRFATRAGESYSPLGANLAWTLEDDIPAYYRRAFAEFADAGLNWTRIWMCHWGGLNLDWGREGTDASPPPGQIDSIVAERWDQVVQAADAYGIHFQMVLQHHGQYSTEVDPNWEENPWNAANPHGFLASPGEFFTSPRARELSKRKYRYIVARWGYSPAILAWELFNETHWVDAMRRDDDVAAVVDWHAEMAAYLRSLDPNGHLVVTSCDPVTSPVFAAMDFLQPHLYAVNMLIGIQRYDLDPLDLDRPVFYGEFGEDHMPVSEEVKRAASHLVPPVWASLMGTGLHPAQPWEGGRLRSTGRLRELAAVARFMAQTAWARHDNLTHFAPSVHSESRVPLRIPAGHNWQKRLSPEIDIPLDGRVSLEFADVPATLVGSPASMAGGYPDRITFRLNAPHDTSARLEFGGAGTNGASARVSVDGSLVAERVWPARSPDKRVAPVAFPLPAGDHAIVVENDGDADWFAFTALELDLDVPALAAVGKRSDTFLAAWVWHREGVFAAEPTETATAIVEINAVPSGPWIVTWWDSVDGILVSSEAIDHPGGPLLLATPAVTRHAAVVLERSSSASR